MRLHEVAGQPLPYLHCLPTHSQEGHVAHITQALQKRKIIKTHFFSICYCFFYTLSFQCNYLVVRFAYCWQSYSGINNTLCHLIGSQISPRGFFWNPLKVPLLQSTESHKRAAELCNWVLFIARTDTHMHTPTHTKCPSFLHICFCGWLGKKFGAKSLLVWGHDCFLFLGV